MIDYLSFLVDITSQYHRVPCVLGIPFALNNVLPVFSLCAFCLEQCLPVSLSLSAP